MSGYSWIRKIGSEALDLIYPPALYCISCGKIIDESRTYRLCNECMESMNWITDRHCDICGRPLAENDPGSICFGCAERKASGDRSCFDKGHACCGYGSCEQSVIFAMKYGGRSDIGVTLGQILFDRMDAEYGSGALSRMYDMVIPVPIFRGKEKKRGFNHADVMAKTFAGLAGIGYEPGILVRTRETSPMKGLGPAERRTNISGAFAVRERRKDELECSRVLIVDDIYTTGATVDEIAGLLKSCGAMRVDFIAFAGGKDMISSQ